MTAVARKPARTPAHDRRAPARLAAVQALYQIEYLDAAPDSVVLEFLRHRLDEEVDGLRLGKIDRALFGELVRGVSRHRADLCDTVAAALDAEWSIARLESLLRLILLCGAYELRERSHVPARAIINEYVELARAFFEGKEPGLVNGVLDRLAHSLRAEEFRAPGAGEAGAEGA